MGDIFRVAKISNIFLGCLKFLVYFLEVNGRCCPHTHTGARAAELNSVAI